MIFQTIDNNTLIATGLLLIAIVFHYLHSSINKIIDRESQEYKEANRIFNEIEN